MYFYYSAEILPIRLNPECQIWPYGHIVLRENFFDTTFTIWLTVKFQLYVEILCQYCIGQVIKLNRVEKDLLIFFIKVSPLDLALWLVGNTILRSGVGASTHCNCSWTPLVQILACSSSLLLQISLLPIGAYHRKHICMELIDKYQD